MSRRCPAGIAGEASLAGWRGLVVTVSYLKLHQFPLAWGLRWRSRCVGLGGLPVRSWRKSHGYLRCTYDRSHGHAGAVLRTRKRFRKHRQLADHRVQADGHELRRPDPGRAAVQAARRQRGRQCAHDQHHPGRRAVGLDRHLYGDQRRRLLRRAEAVELRRQPAGVRRHRPLHPARRLPARQERLPGQRRRLLPDGHSGRSVDRQPGRQRSDAAAVPERLPAGAGRPRRSSIAPISPPIR